MVVSSMMIFFFTGCSFSNAVNSTPSQKQVTSSVTDKSPSNNSGKKILIAYFSHTGNTQKAAEQIHDIVGGDIVEIKTLTPYPKELIKCIAVAKMERETNARPALSTKIDNINDYDIVFVGYPIWGHTVPMAIYTFLESYDLSGKIVIPFCTSSSSEFAESMPAIQSLCPNSTILEGVRANDPKEVEAWLSRIGMH